MVQETMQSEAQANATQAGEARKIFSQCVFFHSASQDAPGTYRIAIEMEDPIDGRALRAAADGASKRYPYLLTRWENRDDGIYLVPTGKPFAVVHSADPVKLGSAEANDALYALSYWENSFYVNGFHGVADGKAFQELFRTLLWFYCTERYGVQLSREGIRLSPSEIASGEYDDPFLQDFGDDLQQPLPSKHPEKVLLLGNDPRVTVRNRQFVYRLDIEERSLMRFCRTNDGSPAVTISLVLARAIARLNPESDAEIEFTIARNLRGALNALESEMSLVDAIPVLYDERLAAQPFDKQNTICRGRVFLANDIDLLKPVMRDAAEYYRMVSELPTRAEQRAVASQLHPLCGPSCPGGIGTFMVSYAGKARLGDAEQFAKAMRLNVGAAGSGIMIEMSALNGRFMIDFAQEWRESLYFDAFCEELELLGIPFEFVCGEECAIPDLDESVL